MVAKAKRDRIIGEIVEILFEAGANRWGVQDKGVLLAAVKLQLRERAGGEAGGEAGGTPAVQGGGR